MASRPSHKTTPAKRVTLSDIAEKSDVSLTTVSLVLRNKAGSGIPSETRQRVLETARDLGYRGKPQLEVRQAVNQIGILLRAREDDLPLANPFYSTIFAGIEAACRQNRVNLLSATLPVDDDNYPLEIPRLLDGEHVDGLLLVGTFVDRTLAHLLGEKSVPTVLADAYSDSTAYDAVVTENYQSAHQAVSYLIEHGHRHIGIVGSLPRAYPSIRERRRGYSDALQKRDITTMYFADCHLRREEAFEATIRLLTQNPQLTALFGVNDDMAIVAMRAAQTLGKRVPQDISIIGFDDIDLAHLTIPTLTTMQVDKFSLGRTAVQTLINRVQGPDAPRVTVALGTRLIERQSVQDIR
ncbi:MAG TPA: LacI family DNA-binding transcriptional regulator [Anaerolineae bacterium]|nr:LacI family DNA-binding transcriptional regulator [Anaerolineae bacterium]